jgi:hypothetical protein
MNGASLTARPSPHGGSAHQGVSAAAPLSQLLGQTGFYS